ncbi:MAG: sulfur carrier protein ThiS [Pseudomonadota bacterium]|nr:sulfur carrier protein ThiS [Pseudomonadota bacterium]
MTQNKIQVFINGKKKLLEKNKNLTEVLKLLKITKNGIAIEINSAVVPKSQYVNTFIKDNDRIEIVQFIGGG